MDSTESELLLPTFHFSVIDYCVFWSMLVLSGLSGFYFGYVRFRSRKARLANQNPPPIVQDEESKRIADFGSKAMSEYLLGSRKLKAFPVAMSLVASYVSGVTILGTPSEIYNYGTQYWMIVIPIALMGIAVSMIYLPVFTSLQVGSSYEYLELRFGAAVRTIASVMFVLDEILFLPIILYVPALAFNQVTGANLYLISGVVCIVCIFYTVIGGIKAVVHTDAWQVLVMFVSVVVVAILGTIAIGGPGEIFNRASAGDRINFFTLDTSLYTRNTLMSVLIGGFFYWTSFNSVNQTMVQRYMSLPNLKQARLSIFIFTIGIIGFVSFCCYLGVLIYAVYHKCDPMLSGAIKADDQLFPLYIMEVLGSFKGIPGLFIAGIFGAALSSLSVVLNSTAGVILEDIFKGCFKLKPSEHTATLIVKGSILTLGGVAVGFIFVIEKLGGILGVATSLTAIAAGTTFGVFTLGMLVPWSNNKGALAGAIAGALMSGWISFGSQIVVAAGKVASQKLSISVDECKVNVTMTDIEYPDQSEVFPLYRLSFHWINPIGIFSVLIVGTIVSFLTGPRDLKSIDPELISPVIHRFLPQECFENYGSKLSKARNLRKKSTGTNISREATAETFTYLIPDGQSSHLYDTNGQTYQKQYDSSTSPTP